MSQALSSATPSPLSADIMNVAAKAARALASFASPSRLGFSTASILLRTSAVGLRKSASRSSSVGVSAAKPCWASIITHTTSASAAPLHALATMARSSRRRGANNPGVSTRMIWARPAMAMPRSNARVVCALGVTIATLLPTSALTSVDLPTLVAPISATNPQRVRSSIAGCRVRQRRCGELDALAREQQRRGRLLGGALVAADAFGRGQVGQLDADAKFRVMLRPAAGDLPIGGCRQAAALRPFLQHGLGVARRARARAQPLAPQSFDQRGRHRITPVQEHRTDHRLADVGENRGAAAATGIRFRTP